MRVIIFDTEWGEEWPLSSDDPEEPLVEPAELGLSADLIEQLRAFYDFWHEHDQPGQGWDLFGNQQLALNEAARLVELLTLELEGRFEVRNQFRHTRGPAPLDSGMRPHE